MKLSYNIPTQTVALEMEPKELGELTDAGRQRVREAFCHMVEDVKAGVKKINPVEIGKVE